MHMCNSMQFHLAMAGIECTGVYRDKRVRGRTLHGVLSHDCDP